MPLSKHRSERRAHSRYPVDLTVRFGSSAQFTREKEQGTADVLQNLCLVQNISEGGLCMLTAAPLENNQVVSVRLPVIHQIEVTTRTLAEVVWVRQTQEIEQREVGLRFLL